MKKITLKIVIDSDKKLQGFNISDIVWFLRIMVGKRPSISVEVKEKI